MKWGLKPEERFWLYVDKNGPNGCWIWTGKKDCGSARFVVQRKPTRICVHAHRYAWELVRGEKLPRGRGKILKRKCDSPLCVNPDHMWEEVSAFYKEKRKRREQRINDFYKELKETTKCSKCGFQHPGAIQFHHKDPREKGFEIGEAKDRSVACLQRELAKCIPLCANCHMIHHWEERQKKKAA